MKNLIITNNPRVKEKYKNIKYIEGTYLEVLKEARDLVYRNYKLITHPLGASARMNFSPYGSIIIGRKLSAIDSRQINIIETSIENYKKYNSHRNIDYKNSRDYELLDLNLLESSF